MLSLRRSALYRLSPRARSLWIYRASSRRCRGGSVDRDGVYQRTDEIPSIVPLGFELVLDLDVRLRFDLGAQIDADRDAIQLEGVSNPAVGDVRRVHLACRRGDPCEAFAVACEMQRHANPRG